MVKTKRNYILLAAFLSLSTLALSAGTIDINDKFYGDNENRDLSYGDGNRTNRIQVKGNVDTFTDQAFKFDLRDYEETDDNRRNGYDNKFQYFFHHGAMGNTKIKNITFVEYQDYYKNDTYMIGEKFNFAGYFPTVLDYFSIVPFYDYARYEYNDSHQHDVGAWLEFGKETEWWTLDATLTFTRSFYGSTAEPNYPGDPNKKYKNNSDFTAEIYYTQTMLKYSHNTMDYKVKTEFGIDPYEYSHIDTRWNAEYTEAATKSTYSAYMMPYLEITKNFNQNLKAYTKVCGDYRYWRYFEWDNTRSWSWQPFATVGIKYSF